MACKQPFFLLPSIRDMGIRGSERPHVLRGADIATTLRIIVRERREFMYFFGSSFFSVLFIVSSRGGV